MHPLTKTSCSLVKDSLRHFVSLTMQSVLVLRVCKFLSNQLNLVLNFDNLNMEKAND